MLNIMCDGFKLLVIRLLRIVGGIIGGLASITAIFGLLVSVKTLQQTERIHTETEILNQQMHRREQVRQSKESIEKYLVLLWYSKAVQESNRLNDSLRVWDMEPDFTCYIHLKADSIRYEKARNESALRIVKDCLKMLR